MVDKTRFMAELAAQPPASTIDGSLPERRCENCRYWGKAMGLTVCRLKPGVPALINDPVRGMVVMPLYTPMQAHEWCGDWKPIGAVQAGLQAGFGPMAVS